MEDRLARLKSMLEGISPEKANELLIEAGLLKGRTPRKPIERKVLSFNTYRTVYKETICKHCGYRSNEVITLTDKEETVYIDESSRVHILRGEKIKDSIEVKGYVNYCCECREFIKSLPRYDLERRYLIMLKEYAVKMPGEVQTVKPIPRKGEVKL